MLSQTEQAEILRIFVAADAIFATNDPGFIFLLKKYSFICIF